MYHGRDRNRTPCYNGTEGRDREEVTMASQPEPFLTPEEYLALERRAATKSEYYGGEIVAMAGASWDHNLILGDAYREIATRLRRSACQPLRTICASGFLRTSVYTYPDIVIVCGELQFQDAAVDTLLNPTLIVEVLSPSTAAHDQGQKFAPYRSLPPCTNTS
jgi:Uma2 family endonuclease